MNSLPGPPAAAQGSAGFIGWSLLARWPLKSNNLQLRDGSKTSAPIFLYCLCRRWSRSCRMTSWFGKLRIKVWSVDTYRLKQSLLKSFGPDLADFADSCLFFAVCLRLYDFARPWFLALRIYKFIWLVSLVLPEFSTFTFDRRFCTLKTWRFGPPAITRLFVEEGI